MARAATFVRSTDDNTYHIQQLHMQRFSGFERTAAGPRTAPDAADAADAAMA
jgi:hypothetical protein